MDARIENKIKYYLGRIKMELQYNYSNWFGNWFQVLISILFFTTFIVAFVKPIRKRDWRNLGLYEAFIISLFTEMFGVPLTIYILSSFFGLPLTVNPLHGHLFAALLAIVGIWDLEIGVTIVMVVSIFMLLLASYLIMTGWYKIYSARGGLVIDGIYGIIRHPQYLGIILGTAAFLIQWPTIITVIMWPILTYAYYKQAKIEEQEMEEKYGEKYLQYKKIVPMFIPRFKLK
ncbi:MAG: isoprenylcysteine carboxylmethyltransferase family protein [Candidatus Bathyarchaeia archaeon]